MTRPCQIKHARNDGRNKTPPASSTVACCCCFAAAIFWTSLIHSALGHPTSTSSSSPPTTAAARVGEIDAPSNQLGSDELTPDDSSLLTLADQEVVFTPHIRSVDGGAAPRKPHQLLPGVRVQGSAEDRDPSAAAAAERCPRPAYPINRATYCSPELRRCSRDEECSGSGSASACCFNGCIFTCMVPMDAPPNFDWVEETVSKIQPYGGSATHLDLEVPPVKYDDPNVRTAVGDDAAADECHLSASQYKSLQDFRNHDGIRECFCEDGQILCKVGRA